MRSKNLLNIGLMLSVEVDMIIRRCEVVSLHTGAQEWQESWHALKEYGAFLCVWLLEVLGVESSPQLFADLIRFLPVKKSEGQHVLSGICHL